MDRRDGYLGSTVLMRKIFLLALLLAALPLLSKAGGRKKKQRAKAAAADTVVARPGTAIDYRQAGTPLPEMRVMVPGGKVITSADLCTGRNAFVVMFNPTCGHCETLGGALAKRAKEFSRNSVVFLATSAMSDYLPAYTKATGLDGQPQMPVGVDSAGFVEKAYLYSALPQINVYDESRRLIRSFAGETPVDSLRRYLY